MTGKVIGLRVNGIDRAVDSQGVVLDALRDAFGLKGTKFGCGTEQCGACMVLADGKPVYSCTAPVADLAGKSITTVEGLGTREAPHPLQAAFIAEQAAQCGYCTSGMLVRAAALLAETPRPTPEQVRAALDGNLCRCGTYNRIVRAVLRAARAMVPA